MAHAGRELLLADLRRLIGRLEHGPPAGGSCPLPFGLPDIDGHLPEGGLRRGALHEIMERGGAGHGASAALFAAGILARLKGPVLWCLNRRDLFAPGLAAAGLEAGRILFVETWRAADVLPAMEEGLRVRGLAGVVGEVARLGLTPSRRLQLTAEKSGVMALVIRRRRLDAERSGEEPTAALTRWRVSPAPAGPLPAPGVGRARWQVELLRCRGGEPRSWLLESCDAKGRLALPSDLADRPHPQTVRRAGIGESLRRRAAAR